MATFNILCKKPTENVLLWTLAKLCQQIIKPWNYDDDNYDGDNYDGDNYDDDNYDGDNYGDNYDDDNYDGDKL